jgi:hypothetical protein
MCIYFNQILIAGKRCQTLSPKYFDIAEIRSYHTPSQIFVIWKAQWEKWIVIFTSEILYHMWTWDQHLGAFRMGNAETKPEVGLITLLVWSWQRELRPEWAMVQPGMGETYPTLPLTSQDCWCVLISIPRDLDLGWACDLDSSL